MRYNKRVWLNDRRSFSSGSVIAFHGPVDFGGQRGVSTESYIEIADCHGKVRLHRANYDSRKDFVRKLRKLAAVASQFADALEKRNG